MGFGDFQWANEVNIDIQIFSYGYHTTYWGTKNIPKRLICGELPLTLVSRHSGHMQ